MECLRRIYVYRFNRAVAHRHLHWTEPYQAIPMDEVAPITFHVSVRYEAVLSNWLRLRHRAFQRRRPPHSLP